MEDTFEYGFITKDRNGNPCEECVQTIQGHQDLIRRMTRTTNQKDNITINFPEYGKIFAKHIMNSYASSDDVNYATVRYNPTHVEGAEENEQQPQRISFEDFLEYLRGD